MSEHKTLYEHIPHVHFARNVNRLAEAERQGINARIAVSLTRIVGSMPTAYTFVVLAIVGLLAILGVLSPIVALLVAWTSQTLIQLVLLPVIMVAQNVLSRKQELQNEEMFSTTQHSFHDIEQIVKHLDEQDKELLKQDEVLSKQNEMLLQILQWLSANNKPAVAKTAKKTEAAK